ncbi:hypothetical protein [Streptomyces albus]|uniref:FtsK domain-containing protein n=1 Tax=Streptomyces albus TaxID=1888 RepID=A0A8H1LB89_9ACTN|nr:hypothetical protein [Streptomyces albus]TGG81674.1 hypothetical protein D8771_20040 [Streptomyces albus]UVN55667.1 hypothetical protein NR995_14910 [Streptomyces albus]
MADQSLNLTNTKKAPSSKHTTKTGIPLDWSAPHGPLTGALSATTGAGATALLGVAGGMPSGWPLVIGAAGALGHGIGASIRRKLTAHSVVARSASWLLAGGWTTWAMTTGPLSWAAAGTLTALGVGIGALASNAAVHEEAAEQERLSEEARALARQMNAERLNIATEWEERIKRVCGVTVRIFAVEMWESGAGFSLAAELPGGGATWDQVRNHARGLAADAGLPLGCVIHVEEGDRQGRVVLDVPTQNVVARDYPYPADYSPLSILTGIPWGLLPHAEQVRVFLREACALILGPPGSGKSTFVDVVLAGFNRCTDVVTFVIDFKAGACARPWTRPYLEAQGLLTPRAGQPVPPADTRPGVDWVASTPHEARRMLRALLAINAARQHAYQDLMDEEDTTLLPVSAKIPQIQVVVDEGAELLSAPSFRDPVMKEVQEGVKKVMRTTRAMGIRLVLTAVDGNTSALGNTEVRKFSPVGVALTSGESSGNNIAKLFARVKVDSSQLNAKGSGVIGQAGAEGFAPTPFKGWKTAPSLAREVVLATNHRRPLLDEVSARAAGEDYSQRWSPARAGWLWNNTHAAEPPQTAVEQQPSPQPRQPRDRDGLNLSYRRRAGTGPDDADALAARLMQEIDATYGTTTEPDHPRTGDGLNLSYRHRQNTGPHDADDAGGGPGDARDAALRLILAAGKDGTGASAMERDLKPKFGTTRPTIHGWLQEWVKTGEIVRVGTGSKTRYVHRRHAQNT